MSCPVVSQILGVEVGDVPWSRAKLMNTVVCADGRRKQQNQPRLGGDRSEIEVRARYKFFTKGYWK